MMGTLSIVSTVLVGSLLLFPSYANGMLETGDQPSLIGVLSCDPPDKDICYSSYKSKPTSLVFQYVGGSDVVTNTQGGKATVSGKSAGYAVIQNLQDKSGVMALGQVVTIPITSSQMDLKIFSGRGGVQTISIHASCSKDLFIGDKYGGLVLVGYNGNVVCPVSLDEDNTFAEIITPVTLPISVGNRMYYRIQSPTSLWKDDPIFNFDYESVFQGQAGVIDVSSKRFSTARNTSHQLFILDRNDGTSPKYDCLIACNSEPKCFGVWSWTTISGLRRCAGLDDLGVPEGKLVSTDSESLKKHTHATYSLKEATWKEGTNPLRVDTSILLEGEQQQQQGGQQQQQQQLLLVRQDFKNTDCDAMSDGLRLDIVLHGSAEFFVNGETVFKLGTTTSGTEDMSAQQRLHIHQDDLAGGINEIVAQIQPNSDGNNQIDQVLRLTITPIVGMIPLHVKSQWRYLHRPGNAPPPMYQQTGFDDSTWLSATGHIGYGDGDETTVVTRGSSTAAESYLRAEFNVSSLNIVNPTAIITFRGQVAISLNGAQQTDIQGRLQKPLVTETTFVFSLDMEQLVLGTNTLSIAYTHPDQDIMSISASVELPYQVSACGETCYKRRARRPLQKNVSQGVKECLAENRK